MENFQINPKEKTGKVKFTFKHQAVFVHFCVVLILSSQKQLSGKNPNRSTNCDLFEYSHIFPSNLTNAHLRLVLGWDGGSRASS